MSLETISGQTVKPLGLSAYPDMEMACVPAAFDAGIDYFFFYNLNYELILKGLKKLCPKHRDRMVIATGSEARDVQELRTYRDDAMRKLGIDAIDIFYLLYVSPNDDMRDILSPEGALRELEQWKSEGLIRYIGASTHNRPLSLDLIGTGRIDVLMHRYNMAHRKAEKKVLPAAHCADIPVVAFTCTRWGTLLKGHRNWSRDLPKPRAADCYRYALHNPAVQLALTGPKTLEDLRQNLAVLDLGPEDNCAQLALWEEYGQLVYGDGTDSFEVQYP